MWPILHHNTGGKKKKSLKGKPAEAKKLFESEKYSETLRL